MIEMGLLQAYDAGYVCVADAARLLGQSSEVVRRLCRAELLEHSIVNGREYFVSLVSIRRALAADLDNAVARAVDLDQVHPDDLEVHAARLERNAFALLGAADRARVHLADRAAEPVALAIAETGPLYR